MRPVADDADLGTRAVADELALVRLLAEYGHIMDARDWSGLGRIFTTDVECDWSAFDLAVTDGLAHLQEYFAEIRHPIAHHVTNVVTEVDSVGRVGHDSLQAARGARRRVGGHRRLPRSGGADTRGMADPPPRGPAPPPAARAADGPRRARNPPRVRSPPMSISPTAAPTEPRSAFDQVVVVSGHMVDAPDRSETRFPAWAEPGVAGAVGSILSDWSVDSATLVISGGARGADIIVAEEALSMRATVWLLLALPEDEFVAASVRLPGTDWEERFWALRRTVPDVGAVRRARTAAGGRRHRRSLRPQQRLVSGCRPGPGATGASPSGGGVGRWKRRQHRWHGRLRGPSPRARDRGAGHPAPAGLNTTGSHAVRPGCIWAATERV